MKKCGSCFRQERLRFYKNAVCFILQPCYNCLALAKGGGHLYDGIFMTVYIEYALIENFVYDYVLLRLSFFATREKAKRFKLAFSALIGAFFALVCPFITLPSILFLALKSGVGLLLCMLSFGRLKTKKEWGRYAFTALCFFFLTFGYGGAMSAFSGRKRLPPQAVFFGFVCLSASAVFLIGKVYQKRSVHAFIYPCTLLFGEKRLSVDGYYDSGNRAQKNGAPICFVSPELIYELFGDEILKDGGTVRDEMQITTVIGVKSTPLYKGGILVETPRGKVLKEGVYFSPSGNMISREYKVLLNAEILGE